MQIAMIGTGYVGTVSGVCFYDFGHDVVCFDKMSEKIAMLKRGEVPIWRARLTGPMRCSSPWAPRHGGGTAMPT